MNGDEKSERNTKLFCVFRIRTQDPAERVRSVLVKNLNAIAPFREDTLAGSERKQHQRGIFLLGTCVGARKFAENSRLRNHRKRRENEDRGNIPVSFFGPGNARAAARSHPSLIDNNIMEDAEQELLD